MVEIDWKATQKALGLDADGIPGVGTWSAVLKVVAAPTAKPDTIKRMARSLSLFAVALADLTTRARIANYVGQTANETGGFVAFVENLNYSAQRMAEVWPGRYATNPDAVRKGAKAIPNAKALSLANSPEKFAEDVYGARMGNELDGVGDGDGFSFRGAGPIHVTGFSNFLAAENRTGIPFSTHPELMQDPALGTIASLTYWKSAKVNDWIDRGDTVAARSITNTGSPGNKNPEGLPRVTAYEAKLLAVLK